MGDRRFPTARVLTAAVVALVVCAGGARIASQAPAFANMESNLVDYENYPSHFTDHTGPKDVAADVKTMGFDLLSRADNHSMSA